jgi:hypothetical protein
MNCKGFGRKRSWPKRNTNPFISVEGLRKVTEDLKSVKPVAWPRCKLSTVECKCGGMCAAVSLCPLYALMAWSFDT